MHQLRHPLSRATYEAAEGDLVRVAKDGRERLFTRDGGWVAGDPTAPVDPEMCRWIGSDVIHKRRNAQASSRDRASAFQPPAAPPTGTGAPT